MYSQNCVFFLYLSLNNLNLYLQFIGNSYFLARMLKPSKDKLEIRRFEVEIKVYNQREKYTENQLV